MAKKHPSAEAAEQAEKRLAEQSKAEETAEPEQPAESGISKMEAVRRALAELGNDSQPKDLVDFVKARYSIDMDAKNVSVYKSQILKKQRGEGGTTTGPRKKADGAATAPRSAGSGLDAVQLVLRAKELAEQAGGTENLKRLLDALG